MIPFQDDQEKHSEAWMTGSVVATLLLIHAIGAQLSPVDLTLYREAFGMIPARDFGNVFDLPLDVRAGTFVSSAFIHPSAWIAFLNAYLLWLFGRTVEARIGPTRWLILFLFGAVISSLTMGALGPVSLLPWMGAAGGVGAILGAYVANAPRARLKTAALLAVVPMVIEIPAGLVIGAWLAAQLVEPIAFIAALAALLAGGIAFSALHPLPDRTLTIAPGRKPVTGL